MHQSQRFISLRNALHLSVTIGVVAFAAQQADAKSTLLLVSGGGGGAGDEHSRGGGDCACGSPVGGYAQKGRSGAYGAGGGGGQTVSGGNGGGGGGWLTNGAAGVGGSSGQGGASAPSFAGGEGLISMGCRASATVVSVGAAVAGILGAAAAPAFGNRAYTPRAASAAVGFPRISVR